MRNIVCVKPGPLFAPDLTVFLASAWRGRAQLEALRLAPRVRARFAATSI